MDPNVDVDELLRALGKWGRYQKFQLGLLLLDIWPAAFHLLSTVFTGYRPEYECAPPNDRNNLTNVSSVAYSVGSCDITIYKNESNVTSVITEACPNGYVYSLEKDRTFVTEWDLVCSRAALAELTQTLLMFGQALGAAVCTSISDRFGRKTVHVFSHLSIFGVGIGLAFVPNYTAFVVLKFIIGVLQQGLAMSGAVLSLELLPTETRYIIEVVGLLFWATGVSLVTPFGYFLQNYSWRYMQLAISLFSGYSLIQYWLQEESLRWLLINNKIKEAERVVRKAARWNGIKYEDVLNQVRKKKAEETTIVQPYKRIEDTQPSPTINCENPQVQLIANTSATAEAFVVKHLNATYIFREKRIFINSLIMWFTWITNSLTYFALTLTSASLAGNRFLNYLLIGLVEYPAAFVEFLLLNRIGRKRTCIMFHGIAGVSLAIATLFNYFSDGRNTFVTASTIFTYVGKFGIGGSFSTIYLYTPELYPTNLRNVGMGFSSSAARFAGSLAPFAGTLIMYVTWGPGAIFGTMCILVTFLCLYFPETMGHELPQTMDELKQWYKDHSGRRKNKQ